MKQSVLRIEHLSKSYGKRVVIRDISMYARQGESVGLLGPNGAGKTTAFYCITGQLSATRGQIFLNSQDITHLPFYQRARLHIGYLPQENSVFRGLTVEQNIMAILEVVEPSRKKRQKKLDALLDEFSITSLRRSPATALSGGERRRVEIARALANDPKFILLDEPFAGIGITVKKSRSGRDYHRPQRSRNAGHYRPQLCSARWENFETRHHRRNRPGRNG